MGTRLVTIKLGRVQKRVGTRYMSDNWCTNWVIQAPSPHQDHSTNAISAGGGGKCKVGDGNSNTKWKRKHKTSLPYQ